MNGTEMKNLDGAQETSKRIKNLLIVCMLCSYFCKGLFVEHFFYGIVCL